MPVIAGHHRKQRACARLSDRGGFQTAPAVLCAGVGGFPAPVAPSLVERHRRAAGDLQSSARRDTSHITLTGYVDS